MGMTICVLIPETAGREESPDRRLITTQTLTTEHFRRWR